jgi:hypothetical protein
MIGMMLKSHGQKSHQETTYYVNDESFVGKGTAGLVMRNQSDAIP